MSASSAKDCNPYRNVDPDDALHLISLALESRLRGMQYIQQQYERFSRNFASVLEFLVLVGVLKLSRDSEIIVLTDKFLSQDSREKKCGQLVEHIWRKPTKARSILTAYLSQFIERNYCVIHEPVFGDEGPYHSVRDFLMRTGHVSFDPEARRYMLSFEATLLYYSCLAERPILSPMKREAIELRKRDFGESIELLVLQYELERLPDFFHQNIVHVAASNTAAGYDIQSVSLVGGHDAIPRFIEVKAVSHDDLGFYWSKNEVETAKRFSNAYFLYLVPVTRGCGDLEALRIVQNPYLELFITGRNWRIEHENVFCAWAGADG